MGDYLGCKLASILLLSLFLFVSVTSQIPLVQAQIFSDGFESNDFSAWTGTSQSGDAPTVENDNPHHGTYNAEVSLAGSSQGEYSRFNENLPSHYKTIYFRAYYEFSSLPDANGRFVNTLRFYDQEDWTMRDTVRVIHDGTDVHWEIDDNNGNTDRSSATVSTGVDYGIELGRYYDGSAGWLQLWINGILVCDLTGLTNDESCREVFAGFTDSSLAGAFVSEAFVDCVVVDTSYIGVEAEDGQDLSFPLFENLNVWSSVSKTIELSNVLFQNVNVWSSLTMNKEKGFSLFENVLVFGSVSRGIELANILFETTQVWSSLIVTFELSVLDLTFVLFENALAFGFMSRGIELGNILFESPQIWSSITETIKLSLLDLTFILFENPLIWSSASRGIEIVRSFAGTTHVWSSLAIATEGVALDLIFTLWESISPVASLIAVSAVAVTYAIEDVYGLAAIGFILAIVAICLAVVKKFN